MIYYLSTYSASTNEELFQITLKFTRYSRQIFDIYPENTCKNLERNFENDAITDAGKTHMRKTDLPFQCFPNIL